MPKFFKKKSVGYCFISGGVFFLWLVVSGGVLSANSEFNIKALVGEDTTPPTIPALLEVIPVAPTQIDITWSASNDNFMMGGYVLLRDSLQIATTTLTSFIDIGLAPGTLYTYEVYAFDQAGNISTTSNSLATTTPALLVIPIVQTTTPAVTSAATRTFKLNNLTINPFINSATFIWESSLVSRFALRWGRSDTYSDGFIINDVFRTEHRTSVSGLEPGTIYLYELIGYMVNGKSVVLSNGQFKTEARENNIPINVFGLSYQTIGDDVDLSWSFPIQISGATVRILRNHLNYPKDPYDGAIIYEGEGNNFYDSRALEFYSTQYYTVFVIGRDGAFSSGAILKTSLNLSSALDNGGVTLNPEPEIELPDFNFDRADITINQGAKTFTFDSGRITLLAGDTFLVSIPYDALPKHLKSIVATILDPSDHNRKYSFLLRINKDRTAYEAALAPINTAGVSRLELEIFDFEARVVGRYNKQVDFVYSSGSQNGVIFPDKIVSAVQSSLTFGGYFLVLLLLVIWLFFRRRRETEDKH